jgi:hypothetical protein
LHFKNEYNICLPFEYDYTSLDKKINCGVDGRGGPYATIKCRHPHRPQPELLPDSGHAYEGCNWRCSENNKGLRRRCSIYMSRREVEEVQGTYQKCAYMARHASQLVTIPGSDPCRPVPSLRRIRPVRGLSLWPSLQVQPYVLRVCKLLTSHPIWIWF